MKIVIAGAGDVGFHLAKLLSTEAHDIVLIDVDEDLLEYVQSHLDVLTVRGDATSIHTLIEANIKKSDLLIAATSNENTNIVTAVIGKRMGVSKTIARVNKSEYLASKVIDNFKEVGVDHLISPKQLAANEIHRLISESALTNFYQFESGKLYLVGISLDADSPVIGQSVIDTAQLNPGFIFRPIAIQRGEKTLIPRGNTLFKPNDHIYFITQNSGIEKILKITGKEKIKVKNVMIVGGGSIGFMAARLLEHDYKVKLVEIDEEKCLDLAEDLKNTMIIQGDGSNVELLEEEGLAEMDAFIALTGNSESNIISCLVASGHKVYKVISLVENTDLTNLAQRIGVDTIINRKLIAANSIFRYIRKGKVQDIAALNGVNAEIIEFEVGDNALVTKKVIRELDFPKEALIGGVIRGNNSYIPMGEFQVMEGDKVVVFTMPEAINEVEKIFR